LHVLTGDTGMGRGFTADMGKVLFAARHTGSDQKTDRKSIQKLRDRTYSSFKRPLEGDLGVLRK